MLINGSLRLLYIKWGEDFLPIGCLTSDGFDEGVNMLDTTTQDNTNGWKTSVPTTQFYSINFDGLVINTKFSGGDFTKVSLDRLTYLKRNRTLIEWQMKDEDLTFVNSGYGYITNLSDSANVDEYISFNGQIEGYGEPTNTTAQQFYINDGNDNLLQDGNDNLITTA